MREYGRVYSQFWPWAVANHLSDDGKILALYLMTCEHSTIAGVFRVPDGYVAEDIGWGIERVREGFAELASKGFANRCETTKWVWVTKHLKWNPPENPNQVKAAAKFARAVPDGCSWKADFYRAAGDSLGLDVPEDDKGSGTVSRPFRNQEQEQKQHQEQKQEQQLDPPRQRGGNTRGTRLPQDWTLPKPWGLWACERGWPEAAVREEAEKFRDYWVARPGRDGTKLDWAATWRNWIRNAKPPAGVTIAATAGVVPDRWWTTPDGIEAQGLAHDLHFEANGDPMAWIEFTARVWLAAGDGPWLRQGDETTKGAYRRLLEREGLSA